MRLDRFSPEASREFLEKVFEQAGVDISNDAIEEAVELLDGIPGWLTSYGAKCLEGKCDPHQIREVAVAMARAELENLLRNRPNRYKLVLKTIALSYTSWKSIKEYVKRVEEKNPI